MAFWRLDQAWEDAARLKALGAGVVSQQPPPRGEWNLTPFFDSADPQDPLSRNRIPSKATPKRHGRLMKSTGSPPSAATWPPSICIRYPCPEGARRVRGES